MSNFVTLHGFGNFGVSSSDSGGSSGKLNFEVVGGTTEPTNPSENTIWVNTDAEITSWAFNPNQPSDPIEGMVWINVGISSSVEFNALKENEIQLYPNFAKQYISGAWVEKEYQVYKSGSWEEYSLYLYDSGNICENVTGGYNAIGQGMDSGTTGAQVPVISYNSDNIYMYELERYGGTLHTKNKIDLTLYKTLHFNGILKHTVPSETGWSTACYLGIWSDIGTYADSNRVARLTSDINGDAILDVSGLEGEYYIGFHVTSRYQGGASEVTLRKLWLD